MPQPTVQPSSTQPPPLMPFDPAVNNGVVAAEYRIFQDPAVPAGTFRVRMVNRHPTNGFVFEIWREQQTYPGHAPGCQWSVDGGQTRVETPANVYIDRLVWVGHKDQPQNRQFDPNVGWAIDFVRNW